MSKQIESIPEARLLLTSLRSVGYSEEAAIADIIDNCISAEATEIDVSFEWDKQRIVIVDNGIGMSAEDLIKNMRIGSANPSDHRKENDLGRFGMGMKTAAFSLGKRLTVISKTGDALCNATWDLDSISTIGWNLIVYDNEQYNDLSALLKEQGTVVVIEKLDRMIADTSNKAKNRFYSTIRKIENHLSLTFHRFLEDEDITFSISINGERIHGWNPFIPENRATQELAEESVTTEDGDCQVLIQPYVLPHKTKFATTEDYKNAGGYKGWSYHQGIYLYRNKRLIICGTWFDFCKKEPAYNLARIKVDITSESDEIWKIDIKKSTASLPEFARDKLEQAIGLCTDASARVYNSRGTYSRNPTVPNLSYVWEQRKKHGKYSFHINRKHILLNELNKQLDDTGKETLNAYLALVENFAPCMLSGITETMHKSSATTNNIDSIEHAMELNDLKKYMKRFKEQGFTRDEIKNTFFEMPNYRHLHREIEKMLEEI